MLYEIRITHRDIKPENIIVMPNGILKLSDFGISLKWKDKKSTMYTGKDGTFKYMSPELRNPAN